MTVHSFQALRCLLVLLEGKFRCTCIFLFNKEKASTEHHFVMEKTGKCRLLWLLLVKLGWSKKLRWARQVKEILKLWFLVACNGKENGIFNGKFHSLQYQNHFSCFPSAANLFRWLKTVSARSAVIRVMVQVQNRPKKHGGENFFRPVFVVYWNTIDFQWAASSFNF